MACQETSGECFGAAGVVRDAFWGEKQEKNGGKFKSQKLHLRESLNSRAYLAPCAKSLGFGGMLPHSRDKMCPFGSERGVWGDPPPILGPESGPPRGFEDATSTPGAGVGGFGGSPPIQRGDIHPWHGSGGVWGVPPHSRGRLPPLARECRRWSGALPRRSLSVCLSVCYGAN